MSHGPNNRAQAHGLGDINGVRIDWKTRRTGNPWGAVYYATSRGKLKPQPCEKCGTTPAHAHHDDYSKPLEVRWLCRMHHMQHHGITKLTEKEVHEIRADTRPQAIIADSYGIDRTQVCRIKNRTRWGHLK